MFFYKKCNTLKAVNYFYFHLFDPLQLVISQCVQSNTVNVFKMSLVFDVFKFGSQIKWDPVN